VAAELGSTQMARLASEVWDRPVQCWECRRKLDPAEPAAVLLILPEDYGLGTVRFGVHAHPGCARSEIRKTTVAELVARRLLSPDEPEDEPDVDVVATVWEYGEKGTEQFRAYPLVMLSYRSDLLAAGGGAERQDLLVSGLLAEGWHLVDGLDRTYPRAPAGYRLRFTDCGPGEPGQLELISHRGLETSATVQPGRYWKPMVAEARMALVVHGSQYLADWATAGRAAAQDAARSGALVGGIVPAELITAR